jgi:ABC-type bacteriocin/lantibiotic exporter with double-glycine peptidase domain
MPPFYRQETRDTCVPACLRSVMADYGFEISEAELSVLCNCTFDGTTALQAVDAARKLGFTKTSKQTLTLNELKLINSSGLFPIVFINLLAIDGINQAHALVVINISEFAVQVFDPAQGERLLRPNVFEMAWAARHNLTILVER